MATHLPVHLDRAVPLTLGDQTFDLSGRALVMGIVNRTRDSFFDNGKYFELDASLRLADELIAAGADIIDVGGVRAGPGPAVSTAEEIDRVVPAIEAIVDSTGIAVSVDTWSADVADAAFGVGAVIGNDISGFADPEYLPTAARHGAAVVATHIRLAPRVDDPDPHYPDDDVVSAVEGYLVERIIRARQAGLRDDQIIIDAGLDLGKTTPQSIELLGASDRLAHIGPPLLLSASNKGFLGDLLGYPVGERQTATTAALALGVALGCRIVRVHDVEAARRVCRTIEHVLSA
jgi:dihydropteroate synthase